MADPEMFGEINALVGAIGKAFELTVEDAAKAIEAGAVTLAMKTDGSGQRYIEVDYLGRAAQIYHGAICHAPGAVPGRS